MLSEGAQRRSRNMSARSQRPASGIRPRSLDKLGMTAMRSAIQTNVRRTLTRLHTARFPDRAQILPGAVCPESIEDETSGGPDPGQSGHRIPEREAPQRKPVAEGGFTRRREGRGERARNFFGLAGHFLGEAPDALGGSSAPSAPCMVSTVLGCPPLNVPGCSSAPSAPPRENSSAVPL